MKSRIVMAKAAFKKQKNLFTSKLDLYLRKKPIKCYIWSTALCGAEKWTLRTVGQKYLESFEMRCWRRMEKISWTDRVRNEEVLHRVKEDRNVLRTVKRRKANWIGHILRRNCLLKQVIGGKLEGMIETIRRREIRRKQLLDDLKEKRKSRKLKEEALHRTVWRTRFGRGYGPVVRQTAECMNTAPTSRPDSPVVGKETKTFG
jgi:hypothetical protein